MKRFSIILFCAALLGAAFSSAASAEVRVALVVGNAKYVNVPRLENSASDARMVADTLKSLGFTLVGGGAQIDLDGPALEKAIRNFGSGIQGADVALFYYAGHGIQVRGSNYLVPVNADPKREADVDYELEDVSRVLRQMEAAKTRLNLVMLDACRNNPFGSRGLRSADAGLAQMRAPEGTLISFATQPGNVAQDGSDGHSPYSRALVQTISKPGLGVFDAFNEVGLRVKKSTAGSQQPWVSSSPIDGSFYFAGAPQVAAQVRPQAPPPPNPVVHTDAPREKIAPNQKLAALTPPAEMAKRAEDPKNERGVAVYDGNYMGTISSGCPHEPGGPLTIRNGRITGRTLNGTVSPDGKVSGQGGALIQARFYGKMHSPNSGSGGWTTPIGCTGSWTVSRR